jgi:hypothetical protein
VGIGLIATFQVGVEGQSMDATGDGSFDRSHCLRLDEWSLMS